MIKAIIFDFDGLILDTEGPEYQSWQEAYQAHGCSLPFEMWLAGIGSADTFDPYAALEQQLGKPIDRGGVRATRRARFTELMAGQDVLPGVREAITTAKHLGLKVAVASSSSRSWVFGYLAALGLEGHFDAIKCADDVGRTKPDPALYWVVLQALEVQAWEAVALEDSLNGVLAAKRAGLLCVAIPNALTWHLSFEVADLRLSSLAEVSVEELLVRLQRLAPPSWSGTSDGNRSA